ncbi:MAG TPA: hypothetical protein VGH27_34985 [Streptosporangiaceae bacterium]|jgi:hypothetical protein
MVTDELEDELRKTFARAGADSAIPVQARERLLQRGYHPRRGNRRLTVSITAAGAAAALILGLSLSAVIGSAPAPRTGAIQAAAFTLVSNANGTATLTIKPKVLFEPGTLQRDLEKDGIPAMVTTGSFCSSHPTPRGFSQAVSRAAWRPRLRSSIPAPTPAPAPHPSPCPPEARCCSGGNDGRLPVAAIGQKSQFSLTLAKAG